MKRINVLLSAIVGLALTAGASQATEDATWGQIKNQDRTVFAAKPAWKTDGTSTTDDAATTQDAPAAQDELTVSKWVKPKGQSTLYIEDFNNTFAFDDDLYVTLTVPNGAVTERTLITMTVTGHTLSELVITFQPGGLEFLKDASLAVTVGGARVDVDTATLQVYHEYSDGTVEETPLTFNKSYPDGYLYFEAVVPGFSRYGLW